MATSFPGAIDSFTNPSSGQFLNSPSHSQQHDNINDAMAAVQAKLGATGSAVTTSHTYKLGGVTGTDLAVSKTGAETLTNKTLTTPIIAQILNSGTLTLPTSTDTLVGRATTDTLTNKTLTSPKVGTSVLDTNGNTLIRLTATGSAVNDITIINAAAGNAPVIQASGAGTNVNLNLRGKGTSSVQIGTGATPIYFYDFVYSGCVWSGDSYGVNLNASMTSGVIVINGNPLTVAAVTARAFTLNVDTYIDASDNGDGTALLTYTTAATNAASPALSANSVRIGIIQAGATITAVGAVNQGQETKVLPIASSTPYQVTDSLGNLICPRDPFRKMLGLRQTTSSFSVTSATAQQITGLICPVIVPTLRKIKITGVGNQFSTTTVAYLATSIWDGTVGSGTQLQEAALVNSTANAYTNYEQPDIVTTPSATSKTYGLGARRDSGTSSISSSSTNPSFIRVDLW